MRCFDVIYDPPRCRREHAALIPLATECLMQKTSYIALVMIAAATAAGAQPASIVDDAGTLHLPDGEKIPRSEEHTSELQSIMRNSYAVFCLKKKNTANNTTSRHNTLTSTSYNKDTT